MDQLPGKATEIYSSFKIKSQKVSPELTIKVQTFVGALGGGYTKRTVIIPSKPGARTEEMG